MKNKYVFVAIMLSCILLISGIFTGVYVSQSQTADTDDNFVVVTSFYPMYIAALNVVKDVPGVTLKNLSEPQTGCLHDFQLTPQDMKLLSTADVFIINGGGIESFMEQIASAYPQLVIIEGSEGIELLCEDHEHEEEHKHEEDHIEETEVEHDHGVNAHAWMSVSCYRRQVENIARNLMRENPANAVEYERNAAE
jgi:zinc transport system substrate-binding protein